MQYLSPLGWEHINLTGDYVWRQNKATEAGQLRSNRDFTKISHLFVRMAKYVYKYIAKQQPSILKITNIDLQGMS